MGSHSFNYAMEFPFKLTFQPLLEDMGQYTLFYNYFLLKLAQYYQDTGDSGNGVFIRNIWVSDSAKERGSNHIDWTD